MTEEDLREIEQLGPKPARLVRAYRDLHMVARQVRRLGYVASDALTQGEVDVDEHAGAESGAWLIKKD